MGAENDDVNAGADDDDDTVLPRSSDQGPPLDNTVAMGFEVVVGRGVFLVDSQSLSIGDKEGANVTSLPNSRAMRPPVGPSVRVTPVVVAGIGVPLAPVSAMSILVGDDVRVNNEVSSLFSLDVVVGDTVALGTSIRPASVPAVEGLDDGATVR